jgi:hypothetical protein
MTPMMWLICWDELSIHRSGDLVQRRGCLLEACGLLRSAARLIVRSGRNLRRCEADRLRAGCDRDQCVLKAGSRRVEVVTDLLVVLRERRVESEREVALREALERSGEVPHERVVRFDVELALRLLLDALLFAGKARGLCLTFEALLLECSLFERLHGNRHQSDLVGAVEHRNVDVVIARRKSIDCGRDLAERPGDHARQPPSRKKCHANGKQAAENLHDMRKVYGGAALGALFAKPRSHLGLCRLGSGAEALEGLRRTHLFGAPGAVLIFNEAPPRCSRRLHCVDVATNLRKVWTRCYNGGRIGDLLGEALCKSVVRARTDLAGERELLVIDGAHGAGDRLVECDSIGHIFGMAIDRQRREENCGSRDGKCDENER